MTATPCTSCGEPRDRPPPQRCEHRTSHVELCIHCDRVGVQCDGSCQRELIAAELAIGELEAIADRLRLTMNRLRQERDFGGYVGRPYSPLPWSQLTESERNQWRDHARACVEVMR